VVQYEAVKRGPLAAGPCGVGRHCRWHVQAVVSAAPIATEVATPSGKKESARLWPGRKGVLPETRKWTRSRVESIVRFFGVLCVFFALVR